MSVYCQVYAGPFDGMLFPTPSPFVTLWLEAHEEQVILADHNHTKFLSWRFEYRIAPFEDSIQHWLHHIDEPSGFYIYTPFQPLCNLNSDK